MNTQKMQEVFADKAFVKSLFELDTAAEVQAALKERGIELTEEEILAIRDLLVKVESGEITKEQLELWQQQSEDGELSDEMLEHVAGGICLAVSIAVCIGMGIAVGGMAATVDVVVHTATGRHW